jgi:tetratricopeptide (TPR) repeat protein
MNNKIYRTISKSVLNTVSIMLCLLMSTSFCYAMSAKELIEKARSYRDNMQYREAVDYYTKVLEAEDLNKTDNAVVYKERGDAYSRLGLHDRAIEDLNRAIEINPRYAGAYNDRGLCYYGKGLRDRAIEDLNKAIEVDPRYVTAYNNRATAFREAQQYDRAMEDLNKALELNPEGLLLGFVYMNMARVYSLTNKTEEACKMLRQTIETEFLLWNFIKSDKNFDNIRDSSCYKEIMSGR